METSTNNTSGSALLDNVRLIAENSPAVSVAENAANGTVVALAGARDVDTVSMTHVRTRLPTTRVADS